MRERLLLDTCTFIWLVAEPARLSQRLCDVIDIHANELRLSAVSIWEICLKWKAGKLDLPKPPRSWIEEQVISWNIGLVPIEREHLYRVTELPMYHRDPFDRLLVAQSIVEGLTVATPDSALHKYPISWLW